LNFLFIKNPEKGVIVSTKNKKKVKTDDNQLIRIISEGSCDHMNILYTYIKTEIYIHHWCA